MNFSLRKLLRIREGEERLLLVFAYILFANFMALEMSSVVATSGFLSEAGIDMLPLIWIVDMAILLIVGTLQSLIIDRIERLKLMRGVIYTLALIHLGLLAIFTLGQANSGTFALLYILADQQLFFVPVVFWVLANDKMSVAQSRRLFPTIAALGFAGQVVGLGLSTLGGLFLDGDPRPLLLVNVLVFLPCLWLIRRLGSSTPVNRPEEETLRDNLKEGWDFIWQVPAFRYLMLSMLAVGIGLTLIEFHFLVVTSSSFASAASYQTFLGSYRLVLALLTIAVQGLVTSRLIDRLTLPKAFYILPGLILAAASLLLASPGLAMTAIARGGARLGLATVDESARKSLQGLIPPTRRGRVSLFLDNYVFAVGILLGAIVVGILLMLDPLAGVPIAYLGFALVLAAGATYSIRSLNRTYETSLLNWRLKRRKWGRSVLHDVDFGDSGERINESGPATKKERPARRPRELRPVDLDAVLGGETAAPRRRRKVGSPLDLID